MNKLSLFSGIGGDDLASEWAGIETVCFVEIDEYCQKVLRKYWPNIPIIGRVQDVTKEKIREVTGQEYFDIIAGGDPCQPESNAGERKGADDDRYLWPEMFRIVKEFKPAWVINENPTGRLTISFYSVLSDLESAGYETRAFIIPACAVNAWHRRDRLYIVAQSNTNADGQRLSRSELRRASPRPQITESATPQPLAVSTTNSDSKWKQQSKGIIQEVGGRLEYKYWKDNPIKAITRFCRNSHGVPARVDRIRALGNSQVPQQIYPIYKAIVEIENS